MTGILAAELFIRSGPPYKTAAILEAEMSDMRLIVAGAAGRMGCAIIDLIAKTPGVHPRRGAVAVQ